MSRLQRSLGARLTFYYSAAATISAAILFLAGYVLIQHQLIRGLDELNNAEFEQLHVRLGPDYAKLPAPEIADRIRYLAEAGSALFYIYVDEPKSGMVFTSRNLNGGKIPDIRGSHIYTTNLPSVGEIRVQEYLLPPFDVTIATPMAQLRATMHTYLLVCAILLIIMLFTSSVIGFGLSRLFLRPIRFIRDTAGRINSDNLSERIPALGSQDEMAELAQLLNKMFDRLESAFNQVNRFAAEASHELKTPLSLIRLHGESLLEDKDLASPHVEAILIQLEEVARMNLIIEQMLFLSRAEANAISMNLTLASPEQMLRNFDLDAQALADYQLRHFRLEHSGSGQIAFEEGWLRQVWLNLLNNALAVTPEGGLVTMHSRIGDGQWIVEFLDEGPGLPEEWLDQIFERFAQHKQTKSQTAGSGLGLTISRSIVALHNGTIAARNRTDRSGLCVTVSLPAQRAN